MFRRFSFLTVLLIVAAALHYTPSAAQDSCNQCDSEHCVKLEQGGSFVTWSLPAASSSYFVKVTIKAGSGEGSCVTFTEDDNDGCYMVTGIGTKTFVAEKIGAGPDCKDMSHVLAYWWTDFLGTLTPTATATEPPTTPRVSLTPTVTGTPPPSTVTPTKFVTMTPSPVWSPTPTEEITATPTKNPTEGWMRAYIFCKYEDGSIVAENGRELRVFTDKGLYRDWSDGYGFVRRWLVPKGGLIVEDVLTSYGPCLELYRGGDAYPPGPLFTPFYENGNNHFSGKVGEPAVVCYAECISTTETYLPESGEDFAVWLISVLIKLLPW